MLLHGTDDLVGDNLQHVVTNGLREWSALTSDDDITFLSCKAWGDMAWDILMSLLESIVFLDIVEEISADNNGVLHFS